MRGWSPLVFELVRSGAVKAVVFVMAVVLSLEVGHALAGRRSGSLAGPVVGGAVRCGAVRIGPQRAHRVSILDMSGWTGKGVKSLRQVARAVPPRDALQGDR